MFSTTIFAICLLVNQQNILIILIENVIQLQLHSLQKHICGMSVVLGVRVVLIVIL